MDIQPLVEEKIREGRLLLQELDKTELKAYAAFWYYGSLVEEWRLVLGFNAPDVQDHPKKYFSVITECFYKIKTPSLNIGDVLIMGWQNPLIQAISSAIQTDSSISGSRFTGNYIHGLYIPDAYIYRMNRP